MNRFTLSLAALLLPAVCMAQLPYTVTVLSQPYAPVEEFQIRNTLPSCTRCFLVWIGFFDIPNDSLYFLMDTLQNKTSFYF